MRVTQSTKDLINQNYDIGVANINSDFDANAAVPPTYTYGYCGSYTQTPTQVMSVRGSSQAVTKQEALDALAKARDDALDGNVTSLIDLIHKAYELHTATGTTSQAVEDIKQAATNQETAARDLGNAAQTLEQSKSEAYIASKVTTDNAINQEEQRHADSSSSDLKQFFDQALFNASTDPVATASFYAAAVAAPTTIVGAVELTAAIIFGASAAIPLAMVVGGVTILLVTVPNII